MGGAVIPEHGDACITSPSGEWLFRPCLGRLAQLGDGAELVRLAASVSAPTQAAPGIAPEGSALRCARIAHDTAAEALELAHAAADAVERELAAARAAHAEALAVHMAGILGRVARIKTPLALAAMELRRDAALARVRAQAQRLDLAREDVHRATPATTAPVWLLDSLEVLAAFCDTPDTLPELCGAFTGNAWAPGLLPPLECANLASHLMLHALSGVGPDIPNEAQGGEWIGGFSVAQALASVQAGLEISRAEAEQMSMSAVRYAIAARLPTGKKSGGKTIPREQYDATIAAAEATLKRMEAKKAQENG